MAIYALDAVDDAVGPTRTLVSRLGVGGLLKLGLVTVFVGGVGSVSFSANLPREVLRALPSELPSVADGWAVAGTATAVVVVGLALTGLYLVRSLLEFAFYEALRDGRVEVRASLRRWWLHGVQLWGLRAALAWSTLVGGAALASTISTGTLSVGQLPRATVLAATVGVTFAVYALLAGFTTRFVVPVMIVRDCGVLAGWARFLRTVVRSPGQYLSYLVVGPFVRFGADVLALSGVVLVAILLAVPVAVFVVPAVVVVGTAPSLALSPPLVLLASGAIAGYVLLVLLGAMLVRLPFVVYVRYYALAVLRGTDPSLDLLGSGGR